jgi:hypothetical protein
LGGRPEAGGALDHTGHHDLDPGLRSPRRAVERTHHSPEDGGLDHDASHAELPEIGIGRHVRHALIKREREACLTLKRAKMARVRNPKGFLQGFDRQPR